jgi:hypothetical protein
MTDKEKFFNTIKLSVHLSKTDFYSTGNKRLKFHIIKQDDIDKKSETTNNQDGISKQSNFNNQGESVNNLLNQVEVVPVGDATICEVDNTTAKLMYINILSEFRNNKVGSFFLSEIEKTLKTIGHKKLILNPLENRENFYYKNGYTKVNESSRYLSKDL